MGHSLFSQLYSTMPAVSLERIDPDSRTSVDLCEKYSLWNQIDLGSDDFFRDTEYEAFIDPVYNSTNREASKRRWSIFFKKIK